MAAYLGASSKLQVVFLYSLESGLRGLSQETIDRLDAALIEAVKEIYPDACEYCGLPETSHNGYTNGRCPTIRIELSTEEGGLLT